MLGTQGGCAPPQPPLPSTFEFCVFHVFLDAKRRPFCRGNSNPGLARSFFFFTFNFDAEKDVKTMVILEKNGEDRIYLGNL